jgi:hypothetical protein
MRTSDRVFLEIPIIISGTNPAGRQFEENTKALVLSRRGAKIISRRALVPQQELTIRCLKTGLDTPVRVVGPILGEGEDCHYGVAFLHPEANVWGINFPLLDGTENPAGRVFLECASCHAQEVAHLDVFELEVFLANACLTRPCMHCKAPALWMRSASRDEPLSIDQAAAKSRHTIQERKSPRISLKVPVCLRHPTEGQEVVATENVSRGGFRIISQKDRPVGTVLEAALPYSPGAANIFTPVRIVHKSLGVGAKTFAYGVAYIPSPAAPSLTGLRITQPK